MKLDGKTLVLTGANGGLGQAIARELANAGARLILVGMGQNVLDELANDIGSDEARHFPLEIDLSQEQGIDELTRFCQELPSGIDGLINSAGLNRFDTLEHHDYQTTARLVSVNLIAPIILSARLLPMLKTRRESFIANIGSVLGAIGNPGYSVYCATKGGLARFSETLRREQADSSVQVLHLNPRVIKTAMNSPAVNLLNDQLGNKSDTPEVVASLLVKLIRLDRFGERTVGWPEKFFVKVNALLPSLVDRDFAKHLSLIKAATVRTIAPAPGTAIKHPATH